MNRQLGPTDVKRLNRSWRRVTRARLCLLLESVGQPFNLGSITRTAAAFGAAEVWLCGDSADPDHPSARKTALGTGRYVTFRRVRDVKDAAGQVRSQGLRLVVVELAAGAVPLHDADLAGDCCLALGNEDRGCSAALLSAADVIAYIPQSGRVGSLNVTAAAAIALAEARRREWAGGGPAGAGDGGAGTRTGGQVLSVEPVVRGGFLDHPKPIAFAHRGGAAHFPENSWRAFEHAVGLGYAYLETDAHATADGVLVAFHDKDLDRITDRSGAIASLPAREVAAARIAGTDPIPLLEDLIGAWPDVRFNIDVKDWPAARPVAEMVRRTASWNRVCITSFSARRLCATRQYLGQPVCMSTSPVGVGALRLWVPGWLLAPAFDNRWVRCAQIPYSLANAQVLARARSAGLDVHAWTVNDQAVMTSLLDLGIDGIMTDNTELLREVMIGRGQWHPRAGT